MVVIIIKFNGKAVQLPDRPATATVGQRRQDASKLTGVPLEKILFMFRGRAVDDDNMTCFNAHFTHMSVVMMVERKPLPVEQVKSESEQSQELVLPADEADKDAVLKVLEQDGIFGNFFKNKILASEDYKDTVCSKCKVSALLHFVVMEQRKGPNQS